MSDARPLLPVRYTRSAEKDLLRAAVWSEERYGATHCDQHQASLRAQIENLGRYPGLGRHVGVLDVPLRPGQQGYHMLVVDEFSVFYRLELGLVTIVRVLGRGELPARKLP